MTSSAGARGIHRAVLLRVGAATAVITLVFGSLTHFMSRDRLEENLARLAEVSVRNFNRSVLDELEGGSLEPGMLQADLDAIRGDARLELEGGYFVYVRVLAPDGTLLAEDTDRRFTDIVAIVDTIASIDEVRGRVRDLQEAGDFQVAYADVEGDPYLAVALPMVDQNDRPVAVVEGVFAVSPLTVSRLRADQLRTVGYVILIVLATVLAIYPVIFAMIRRLGLLTSSLLDSNLETMQALGGAIAKRDSDTDEHNYRVSVYSLRLAQKLGLDDASMRTLIKGALLHDVGKIGIRDDVLLKPGKLDDAEYTVMKTHVDHGMDITQRATWLRDAQQVVGSHHEKFDGSGYPHGVAGEAIPLVARIFAVVDVFDALTSRRPYKEPIPFDKTMAILEEGRGSHFDPMVLDAFVGIARDLFGDFVDSDGGEAKRVLSEATLYYFTDDLVGQLS